MTMAERPPRVLTIAGSDPSGGAGIQADLKSIAAFQGYGMAAITTLTAQNTRGVDGVHAPPASFLTAQLAAIDADITVDAVKIGMLHSVELIETVDAWLARVAPPVVVLDPVMVATSGHRLLNDDAEHAVRELARRAHLVTPNLSELAVMVGESVAGSWPEAIDQGRRLATRLQTTVLVKGGHLAEAGAPDALVTASSVHEVFGNRVPTLNTHGTGCSLSSAMATLRATGLSWDDALVEAKHWMEGALLTSDSLDVGEGNGPINHLHRMSASGEWARAAWIECAAVVEDVLSVPFVADLGAGTLDPDHFRRYIAQDAHYLDGYSAVLAELADLAPDAADRDFWRAGAEASRAEVDRLHAEVIGEHREHPVAVTTEYLAHLRSAVSSGSYARAVAAVLPCYALYADLGVRWLSIARSDHAYAAWLELYGGAAFVQASARAERIASVAADRVDRAERRRMAVAYRTSMQLERRFFAETPLSRG